MRIKHKLRHRYATPSRLRAMQARAVEHFDAGQASVEVQLDTIAQHQAHLETNIAEKALQLIEQDPVRSAYVEASVRRAFKWMKRGIITLAVAGGVMIVINIALVLYIFLGGI